MERAVENALAELCLGPGMDPKDPAQVRAWLTRHEVADSDRDFLLAQGVERLLVYRRLVRATLRDAVELAIPRTIARLGSVFDEYFSEFLAARGPRTHFLRDVTGELLTWVRDRWSADERVVPYAWELARHEALRIELAAQPTGAPLDYVPALDLERGAVFIEAARIARYEYRVHELPDAETDRSEPAHEPVALLVYRSAEHEVRYLELSPMAATVLAALMDDGHSLGQALQGAAEQHGVALDDSVIQGTAHLLTDLATRGVLLGARRSAPD